MLPSFALFFLPLCASTVVEGRLSSGGASLWYRVHRPELLFDAKRKPLLVLHGGDGRQRVGQRGQLLLQHLPQPNIHIKSHSISLFPSFSLSFSLSLFLSLAL